MGCTMIRVNLLPPKFVWRKMMRKRVRQWICFLGLVTLLFSAWNASYRVEWWRYNRDLKEIEGAVAPVRQSSMERIELTKKTILIEKKLNQLREIAFEDGTTSTLSVVAKGVLATNNSVQVQELQVSPSNSTSTSKSSSQRNYIVSIRGIAAQSDSITKFMDSLNRSGIFPRVELRATQELQVKDQWIQEFQLECLNNE
jgi:Tfp pilus assembly protein PilN